MPLRAKSAGRGMSYLGEAPLAGESAPERQTIVRGLRVACRNISVSLKDAGPWVAGSTEKAALRRSGTHWYGVLGTCDCVDPRNSKKPQPIQERFRAIGQL